MTWVVVGVGVCWLGLSVALCLVLYYRPYRGGELVVLEDVRDLAESA